LYDISYSDLTEEQNETEDRIKETPRLETQYVFSDREQEHKRILMEVRTKNNITSVPVPVLLDKTYFLSAPLGRTKANSEYAPAWSLRLEKGKISGSVDYMLSEVTSLMKIPQVNLEEITFLSSVKHKDTIGSEEGASVGKGEMVGGVKKLMISSEEFSDGSFVSVEGSGILLNLEEENVPFEKENFEIEVFKVRERIDKKQELTPLSFVKSQTNIVNDVLLDEVEKPLSNEIDGTFVEYYFDFFVDSEIEEKEVKLKKKNNLYDSKVLEEDGPFGKLCNND
jgi:hypothetical protein